MSIVVVGAGPSGLHLARTLLEAGHTVTLVDGGRDGPPPVLPDRALHELKEQLDDPVAYFLGEGFEGVSLPSDTAEYYGIPPHKQYIFDPPVDWSVRGDGFQPLFSFARGGLAQAWTGGSYPFNEAELAEFPFSAAELAAGYDEVARRIGIAGAVDDLAPFVPVHEHLQEPVPLDPSSALLLAAYQRGRSRLQDRYGVHLGRSRVATLTRPHGGRPACSELGRCLWGCPTRALYTPDITLEECLASPRFRYLPGLEATAFRYDEAGLVRSLRVRPLDGGGSEELAVGRLVLAAGALGSTRIYLQSLFETTGEVVRLGGLMDNRQALVPFSHLRMLGRPFAPRSYQYNQLCLGLPTERPEEYVHGLITTLTTAMIHPVAQQLPLDLGTALLVTRALHSTLGVVNLNFHDRRRDENGLWLAPGADGSPSTLEIRYRPDAGEGERIASALKRVRRALLRLGCVVPPGMAHLRPMGAGVHYAGTLPMTADERPHTTRPDGSLRGFQNLFVADGATFPFLPAKNITFSLMANAVRIARRAFSDA